MSDTPNSEHAAEYPRHIMLTVVFTQLKEKGMDDIADLLQQMHKAHHAQNKRMADLEAALSGLADLCEEAGFDCQRARAVLANETGSGNEKPPVVTDEAHIAMLQEALAFWLPMVQGPEEMSARIANDAWLLCGMLHADVDKPSAEALGWISINIDPTQRQTPPFISDMITRLRNRVLLAHGGQAYSWEHQFSLTQKDSQMHKEAAELIEALLLRSTVPAHTNPGKQQKIDELVPNLPYPTSYEDLARISSTALFNRWIGGRSAATVSAEEAFTAARSLPFVESTALFDPVKLVQVRNVALEEAALISDGLECPVVSDAIRGRILTGVGVQNDYAAAEKEHFGDPDLATGIYAPTETSREMPAPFPERDQTKPAEQQGLFHKFDVHRTDGSDRPGGKHYGCRYFVLDMTHDQHTPAALRGYAASCAVTHPILAADLNAEFGKSAEQYLQNAWKAYITVAEGIPLRPSRHVPDGTYALIPRDQWDAFSQHSNQEVAARAKQPGEQP